MLLSTHAIDGSDAPAPGGARAALWLRYADLVLLALALPVFVLWLVTLAILLVGLLGDREDGLAAAVLSLFLVSFHLGGMAISKLFEPQADR